MYQFGLLVIYFVLQAECYRIQVHLAEGVVIGTKHSTIFKQVPYFAFYQIPFAAPPIGDLRFKDPQPVEPRSLPYMAKSEYKGSCAQLHIVHKNTKFGNENCLYMNIFTTNLKATAPVLVWYHGYAFASSFSHIFGSDFLIEHNIVFVSVNYRIGAQGFLKLNQSDTNANMGLKDIVRSLRWIKSNIAKFGGDSKKVTVMGNGSAANYLSLLLMTKWRKLFIGIILHSGGIFSPSIFQGNPILERDRLIAFVKKHSSKKFTKSSSRDLVEASKKIYTTPELINIQRPIVQFTPIVEIKSNNSLITMRPDDYFKSFKRFKTNVSILIGFASQESISEIIPFSTNPNFLQTFNQLFKFMVPFSNGCQYNYTSKTYKKIAAEIKYHYFKGPITNRSVHEFTKFASDLLKYPIYKFIKQLVKAGIQPYVFKFNYRGKFNAMKANSLPENTWKIKGAASGDELCYLMKCEPLREHYLKIYNETDDKDRKFIDLMSETWTGFVQTGNPNGRLLSQEAYWEPMSKETDNILVFEKNIRNADTKTEQKIFEFWNGIYEKYYAKKNCPNHVRDDL